MEGGECIYMGVFAGDGFYMLRGAEALELLAR